MYRNNNAMASGTCSSFQVCDSVSGTCSFQNLPDTYTHVSGGTRNRKRRSWEVESKARAVDQGEGQGRVKNSLET